LTMTSEGTLQLSAGDRLLFFTAGISQCVDADGRPLGQLGLAAIAGNAMRCGLFEMLDEVISRARQRCDGHFKEDLTLVVAELK